MTMMLYNLLLTVTKIKHEMTNQDTTNIGKFFDFQSFYNLTVLVRLLRPDKTMLAIMASLSCYLIITNCNICVFSYICCNLNCAHNTQISCAPCTSAGRTGRPHNFIHSAMVIIPKTARVT